MLIKGLDPGRAQRPVEVDENGNLRVDLVSGIAVSTEINSSTTLPVSQVSGAAWSTYVTGSSGSIVTIGDTVSDGADPGSAPIKTGGIARTANPSAVSDGDRVSASYDDLGRQIITPYQARDLIATAYASPSTGDETELLAGVASTLHDIVNITAFNSSDAAVNIAIRSGTAGATLITMSIPANSSESYSPIVPYPQTVPAQAWTVQNTGADVSGTTVNISALFIKNV